MRSFARKFSDHELLRQGSADEARRYMWGELRWGCYVHGIAWDNRVQVMFTSNMPGMNMLELVTWGAAKGYEVEPTPGYDADGRECWEYPT